MIFLSRARIVRVLNVPASVPQRLDPSAARAERPRRLHLRGRRRRGQWRPADEQLVTHVSGASPAQDLPIDGIDTARRRRCHHHPRLDANATDSFVVRAPDGGCRRVASTTATTATAASAAPVAGSDANVCGDVVASTRVSTVPSTSAAPVIGRPSHQRRHRQRRRFLSVDGWRRLGVVPTISTPGRRPRSGALALWSVAPAALRTRPSRRRCRRCRRSSRCCRRRCRSSDLWLPTGAAAV